MWLFLIKTFNFVEKQQHNTRRDGVVELAEPVAHRAPKQLTSAIEEAMCTISAFPSRAIPALLW